MDDKEMQGMLEKASLLPERWYLVFRQGDTDDHVMMTAYDTSTDNEDDEYIPAGSVILSGLVELMESDFERVMQAGLARLQFEATQEAMGKEAYGNVDMVNSPPHYNQAGVECIDAIRAATDEGYQYYLQGNIIKYLWRYRYKNGVQDLEKAQWYLQKLIEETENE